MKKNMTAKESFNTGKKKVINGATGTVMVGVGVGSFVADTAIRTGMMAVGSTIVLGYCAADVASGTAMMTVVPAAITTKNVVTKVNKKTKKHKKHKKGSKKTVKKVKKVKKTERFDPVQCGWVGILEEQEK